MRIWRPVRRGFLRLLLRISLALLCVGVSVGIQVLQAADPDVMSIVNRMKAAFEPVRPSVRKLVITVSGDTGQDQARWVAAVARKELPDGKRSLFLVLEPESLRGNALLIWERQGQEDMMWIYGPAVRRVRAIVPVEKYERFLRTDFTYADLGFVSLQGAYRFLGEEQHAGVRAYKIEEVPKDQWYYSRIITWVAADSLLPLQRDYYDRAGQLWKTELFEQVTVINGIPTPLRIRMLDVQQDSSTELQMSEVRYDVELPDELFDPKRLPDVMTLPLWQPYYTRVVQGGGQ